MTENATGRRIDERAIDVRRLLGPSLTVLITNGWLVLDTWQHVFHLECDIRPREREYGKIRWRSRPAFRRSPVLCGWLFPPEGGTTNGYSRHEPGRHGAGSTSDVAPSAAAATDRKKTMPPAQASVSQRLTGHDVTDTQCNCPSSPRNPMTRSSLPGAACEPTHASSSSRDRADPSL